MNDIVDEAVGEGVNSELSRRLFGRSVFKSEAFKPVFDLVLIDMLSCIVVLCSENNEGAWYPKAKSS